MTTIQAFFETAARHAGRLAWKHGEREWTWGEAARDVRRTARALIALGVKPGDAVAIVGPNRPEWVMADLGALAAGAVPAPIYPTLTAEQAGYIANHCGAAVALVADETQREKLRGTGVTAFGMMTAWNELLALGDATPEARVDERLRALKPDDLATLIYTSGTTGPPKAVMLTHSNLAFAAHTAVRVANSTADDVLVSYLPLSHVAEQVISLHAPTVAGGPVWFCDELEKIGSVLQQARPTVFFGVPRVWEKMQARVEEAVRAAPKLRRRLFGWSRQSRSRLADRLVLSKVRAGLGLDRARICVTAAAKMPRATLDFFDSLGLPLLDVWGMSESSGMGTANLHGARRPGTVGRPEDGVEIRIAADGEILTRGPHVFRGYYRDAAATSEALDRDGWLHTGDVGELDPDGYLRITDRKKDLLITSGGKNISPQNIEVLLGRIPGVVQAVVVGDARKYLAALIVPEAPERAGDPGFVAGIGRAIEQVNGQLAHYETIKRFKVLPARFSVDSGELTPTLKLKRKVVAQKYAKEIDELFEPR
ncbi:MAG TPA: AMP-dependent synthetase/ligase [Myxococcales bacterium]|nr:AMP-dependent synthetase/ligase [Myxococcales bacterium]